MKVQKQGTLLPEKMIIDIRSLDQRSQANDHMVFDSFQIEKDKASNEAQEDIQIIVQEISKEIPNNPVLPSLELHNVSSQIFLESITIY